MRTTWLTFPVALLLACGSRTPEGRRVDQSGGAPPDARDASAAAEPSGEVDAAPAANAAGCSGYTAAAELQCRQKPGNCTYGPPIWCSGVAPRPEDEANLRSGPCACTCEAQRNGCSLVPSAAPPPR